MSGLECGPELGTPSAEGIGNLWQIDDDGAVQEIGSADDRVDPVYHYRPLGYEDGLIAIAIQFTGREATTSREAAEAIGQPGFDIGEVVEGNAPAVRRGDHYISGVPRFRPQHGDVWVDQRPAQLLSRALRCAVLPGESEHRERAVRAERGNQPGLDKRKLIGGLHVD